MPVSYVELFRPQQQDAVGQILAGGTNVLTGALNNAIQIGRDSVNLRASQERDYLAERERIANLDQRRAEFTQGQENIDRSFWENAFRDRRDTAEANKDDVRDFSFKSRTDARDATMRANELDSIIGARTAATNLAEKSFDLREEDTATKKEYLKSRAADLLREDEPKPFIDRLLGSDPLPEDDVSRGNELQSIGAALGDPALTKRGDALISRGTKGQLTRREERYAAPRSRSSKTPVTIEEQIAELEMEVQAREEELAQLEADGEDPRLTQAQSINLRKYRIKLDQLRSKAGKVPDKSGDTAKSLADQIRETYLRK